ncbi:MAG: peptidase-like protein [Mucilaginibacter sp.]|nr:peptidase-like protein [Mucilaginibacter sp.]
MSKTLCIFLIALLGLTAAAGICHSIISFQIGGQIYGLDSYVAWFLVVNITAVIGTILLLKYYYYQSYRFAFFTGIIGVIANLCYATIVYIILTSGGLRSYFIPVFLFSQCAGILYAISLIFSNTRKRFWLKLGGVCVLVIGLVLVSAVIGSMHTKDARINIIIGKIVQWAPIAGALVNVLFIMNFLAEIRALKTENTSTLWQKSLESILGFAAIVAFIFTIALGILLVNQSSTELYWQNYNAEQAQKLVKLAGGARIFIDSKGEILHYLLIKPMDYDQQKKYPLVVCLPYGGYQAPAAESLSTDMNRTAYRAFLFVPYCPEGEGWGGIPGYPSLDSLVCETISALAEPGIDVKRRYVTGLSRGAYGTWQFICTRPDIFAAAMPVSGGGDPKLAPKAVHVAVWAFHGAKDRNVPVSGSRDMIAAIIKAGGHPEYTEFPDEAHNIWDRVSKTPGLWDWLFAQKRE